MKVDRKDLHLFNHIHIKRNINGLSKTLKLKSLAGNFINLIG